MEGQCDNCRVHTEVAVQLSCDHVLCADCNRLIQCPACHGLKIRNARLVRDSVARADEPTGRIG